MSDVRSSPETSPVESEKDKTALDGELDDSEGMNEEAQIGKTGHPDANLRPEPLTKLPSHASQRSQRSYAGADGYTHFEEDEEKQTSGPNGDGEQHDQYEVTWDGDDDPMNPRSKTTATKWIIVLIVSSCSLCVYAFPTSAWDSTDSPILIWRQDMRLGVVYEYIRTTRARLWVLARGCDPWLNDLRLWIGFGSHVLVSAVRSETPIVKSITAISVVANDVCSFTEGGQSILALSACI